MKKKFNCSWYAVCNVAENHGLEIPISNKWTNEEIETLKLLSDKYHYSEIAKIMNKTENAIYIKARRLGTTLIQDRRKWTEDEIKQVENLFKGGKSYLEIAEEINRSEWSVANLLRNMGYSYMLPQFWKGKELKYLRENYENMTYSEIAEELGRTTKAIGAKAAELDYQKRLIKTKNNGGESNG